MSGARAIPLFLVALMIGLGLAGIAATSTGPIQATAKSCDLDPGPHEMITIPLFGGEVTLPADFEAGERFLQLVEPPVFTRTEQARQKSGLQPGDLGDQGGEGPVVLERRQTDYSHMNEPWTGGICMEDVSGSPGAYVCICDATFILENETALDPSRPVDIFNSQYILVDNLTMYGGAVDFINSSNIIVADSMFIDSGGVGGFWSENGYVHNISVIMQRPPTNLVHHPPETLPGVPHGREFMCWPHEDPPPCEGGGVFLSGGEDWVVEWSYFHGAGGVSGEVSTKDIVIRHNTFRDTIFAWSNGVSEIGWNLIRGTHIGGTSVWGNQESLYHNNSIIMPFKVDHGTAALANPGLLTHFCEYCDVQNNDFIGYGFPHPLNDQCCPALYTSGENHIIANDNYWGTIHDPRTPDCWWICTSDDTTLVLDRWETEPIHDITPIMYTLDHRDVPYWAERITRLPVQDTWNDLPLPDS